MRSELAARLGAALAHPLAGGEQFAAGALGERLHSDRHEHVACRVQLARRLAEQIEAEPELERLADPPLNVVCFRNRLAGVAEAGSTS